MIKSQKSRDFELAYKLYQEQGFGLTENAVLPENKDKSYKPRTLIDQTLELIDPTPNIHTLFVQFNERFFWNVLLPVEVRWSPKMTSCAGTCTFHPRNRQCVISISAPLLKLRPRKDLIETLLHEMIHGYLFLTNNNRDRDGHGPEFCKHMNRINKVAGTKITIYHTFHDEVRLYQQHWWRCNGPCQKRAPYFGTVRRAMNRAPGPTDFWWKEHQQICGGQFIKIKEPENFKTKTLKNKEKVKSFPKNGNSPNGMFNWLIKTTPKSISTPKDIKSVKNDQNPINGLKKLGNTRNNVYGWGTGGPNSSSYSQNHNSPSGSKVSATPKFSSSDVLGGSTLGQSNLLNKLYNNGNQSQKSTKNTIAGKTTNSSINTIKINSIVNNKQLINEIQVKFVECPICDSCVLNNEINKHVDSCLLITKGKTKKIEGEITTKGYTNISPIKSEIKVDNTKFIQKRKTSTNISTLPNKQPKLNELQNSKKANCPICNNNFDLMIMNEHLDKCLLKIHEQDNNLIIKSDGKSSENENLNESIISLSSSSSDNSFSSITENLKDSSPTTKVKKDNVIDIAVHNCLVCNMVILPGTLNDHLEDCIGRVFDDDSSLSGDCDNNKTLEIVSEVSVDQNKKYPCPVCMQLTTESLMNQHLDTCLANT